MHNISNKQCNILYCKTYVNWCFSTISSYSGTLSSAQITTGRLNTICSLRHMPSFVQKYRFTSTSNASLSADIVSLLESRRRSWLCCSSVGSFSMKSRERVTSVMFRLTGFDCLLIMLCSTEPGKISNFINKLEKFPDLCFKFAVDFVESQ